MRTRTLLVVLMLLAASSAHAQDLDDVTIVSDADLQLTSDEQRELTERLSYDEKLAMLDCLFAVAAADERIRAQESNEIGRIANELRIEHKDQVRIRHQYRDRLAALNTAMSSM